MGLKGPAVRIDEVSPQVTPPPNLALTGVAPSEDSQVLIDLVRDHDVATLSVLKAIIAKLAKIEAEQGEAVALATLDAALACANGRQLQAR